MRNERSVAERDNLHWTPTRQQDQRLQACDLDSAVADDDVIKSHYFSLLTTTTPPCSPPCSPSPLADGLLPLFSCPLRASVLSILYLLAPTCRHSTSVPETLVWPSDSGINCPITLAKTRATAAESSPNMRYALTSIVQPCLNVFHPCFPFTHPSWIGRFFQCSACCLQSDLKC